jgi:hypothetical protein
MFRASTFVKFSGTVIVFCVALFVLHSISDDIPSALENLKSWKPKVIESLPPGPIPQEIANCSFIGKTIYLLNWDQVTRNGPWLPYRTSNKGDLMGEHCRYTNCVFTSKKNVLPNVEDYQVIVFDLLGRKPKINYPKTRSPCQIYVMLTNECVL